MPPEFTEVYQRDGKWWVAYAKELPGANTQGRTLAEAKRNLQEAIALVLEANREIALEQKLKQDRKGSPASSKAIKPPRHPKH